MPLRGSFIGAGTPQAMLVLCRFAIHRSRGRSAVGCSSDFARAGDWQRLDARADRSQGAGAERLR